MNSLFMPMTSIHVGTWYTPFTSSVSRGTETPATEKMHTHQRNMPNDIAGGTPTSLASARLYRAKMGYIKLNTIFI